MFTFV